MNSFDVKLMHPRDQIVLIINWIYNNPMESMRNFIFCNIIVDNSKLDKNSAFFITGLPGHDIETSLSGIFNFWCQVAEQRKMLKNQT